MKNWRVILETKITELLSKSGIPENEALCHAKECLEPRHLDTAIRALNRD